MQRFRDLRRTHRKLWFGIWILTVAGVLAVARWQFDNGNPIVARVLGAQAKKPDVTPPTVSVSFPVASGVYGPDTWRGAVSGKASDGSGVGLVEVRLGTGPWEAASGTANWSRSLSMATPGSYAVSVRAIDRATPAANTSDPVIVTFQIDTQAPPPPTITSGPENPTIETSARFDFSGEPGARFECQLDAEKPQACSSAVQVRKLSVGDHSLRVVAIDAAGNRSAASAPWTWTVLINKAFGISGNAARPLYPASPGTPPSPLNLKVSNPYNFDIEIVSIDVVPSAAGPCGTANLDIRPLASTHTTPMVVPANSALLLSELLHDPQWEWNWPADWPAIALKDTHENQDLCKDASFTLRYSGTATKP